VRDHETVRAIAGSWAEAAQGDGAVFAIFYERHADRVFAHCFSRVGSRIDAEDLTAQVFEIAWRRRADVRVDESADILPWLLATANNLVAGYHRTTARRWGLIRRLPSIESEPDHATTLSDRDELDRELALAMTVLQALRPADREVIELCVMHGLSPTAAAIAAGTSASTMRTRLARALARARGKYSSATLRADRVVGTKVNE
jgi:RNA polymerase sigma factor (sigma-70 family)